MSIMKSMFVSYESPYNGDIMFSIRNVRIIDFYTVCVVINWFFRNRIKVIQNNGFTCIF